MKDFLKQRIEHLTTQISTLTEEKNQRLNELKDLISRDEWVEYIGISSEKETIIEVANSSLNLSFADKIKYVWQRIHHMGNHLHIRDFRDMVMEGTFGSVVSDTLDSPSFPVSTEANLENVTPLCRVLKNQGHIINAIKLYRAVMNEGLYESKQAVDAM